MRFIQVLSIATSQGRRKVIGLAVLFTLFFLLLSSFVQSLNATLFYQLVKAGTLRVTSTGSKGEGKCKMTIIYYENLTRIRELEEELNKLRGNLSLLNCSLPWLQPAECKVTILNKTYEVCGEETKLTPTYCAVGLLRVLKQPCECEKEVSVYPEECLVLNKTIVCYEANKTVENVSVNITPQECQVTLMNKTLEKSCECPSLHCPECKPKVIMINETLPCPSPMLKPLNCTLLIYNITNVTNKTKERECKPSKPWFTIPTISFPTGWIGKVQLPKVSLPKISLPTINFPEVAIPTFKIRLPSLAHIEGALLSVASALASLLGLIVGTLASWCSWLVFVLPTSLSFVLIPLGLIPLWIWLIALALLLLWLLKELRAWFIAKKPEEFLTKKEDAEEKFVVAKNPYDDCCNGMGKILKEWRIWFDEEKG